MSVPYLFPNYLFYYDEQNKSWQVNDTPEFPETTVTWELEEIDANKTRVDLVHSVTSFFGSASYIYLHMA
ncbi:MAG: hypothetical protein WAZ77_07370 [Candidatus Nitrosopolaris sp.]